MLSSITVYQADGKCHKTAASASYMTSRAADKSVTILTHPSADCSAVPTITLDVTSAQAIGQLMRMASLTKRSNGNGVTPLMLKAQ
ncbi:hypothetical protein GN244_ATG16741 [Phytophthora infestans]|uniref:Uncharacterized protein n=1 Tax=Phytophthora infestans TaxID=4787 RepID=A0A833SBT1_PHYIN|nr:hypothetical protein GN244_ATG16741 [Phytophthora infestans]